MKNPIYDLVIGNVPGARDVSIPQLMEHTTRGVQTECEAMKIPATLRKSEEYLKEQGAEMATLVSLQQDTIKDVGVNTELSKVQQAEIQTLLEPYKDICTDVPSLATNAWTGAMAASSSSTSAASDLRLKFYYDRDMLMVLKSSRLSHVQPACLSSEHETGEGVWDPDRWFASVSNNTSDTDVREKCKQPVDVDTDSSLRKRPSGNGSKLADTVDADDDEHISLTPQRSSFLSGCQVKQSAAGPDSKRDGRESDRQETARVGSGRIQIIEELDDKELRKDDRGAGRYDRHRDGSEKTKVIERRRTDRDTDDLGRGCYSRDSDTGLIATVKTPDTTFDVKARRFRSKNDNKAEDLPHRDGGYFATGRCSRRRASCGICKPKITTMNLYSTFDRRNFRMEGSCDGHLLYSHTGSCYVPSVDETMLEPIV